MHGLIDFSDVSTISLILKAIIGAGGIGAVVSAVISYLKWKHEHAEVARLSASVATLEQQLTYTTGERDQLRSKLGEGQVSHALAAKDLHATIEDLTSQNGSLKTDVAKHERSLRQQKNLSSKLLGMEGEVWRAKALTKKPAFIPIHERSDRKPVVFSVLNLKGGVGKTTLTANIGAALASMGKRVLFIDVDLQGSLTSLLMPFEKIASLAADNLMLQDFLTTIASPGPVNLLPYTSPIFEESQSCIVPTSDHLAYADMNLMTTWMLRIAKRDSRFLLRRGLHQKRIFSKFDVVLIDCPPLLNSCCVNALAASDFVVIPATPSEHSVDRVPQLVYTLKHSIASLNPHLSVAGIVYNQTRRAQLSAPEQAIWSLVLKRAEDQYGSPVRGFGTHVRNMPEIRDTESNFEQAKPGMERFEVFRSLAEELLEVVPSGSNQVS